MTLKLKTNNSSKCYSMLNYKDQSTKRAMKGVHCENDIDHDSFINCLYSNSVHYSNQVRMNFLKKYGTMGILEIRKRALNPIFTKLEVQDDLVTVRPLKKDNKFL